LNTQKTNFNSNHNFTGDFSKSKSNSEKQKKKEEKAACISIIEGFDKIDILNLHDERQRVKTLKPILRAETAKNQVAVNNEKVNQKTLLAKNSMEKILNNNIDITSNNNNNSNSYINDNNSDFHFNNYISNDNYNCNYTDENYKKNNQNISINTNTDEKLFCFKKTEVVVNSSRENKTNANAHSNYKIRTEKNIPYLNLDDLENSNLRFTFDFKNKSYKNDFSNNLNTAKKANSSSINNIINKINLCDICKKALYKLDDTHNQKNEFERLHKDRFSFEDKESKESNKPNNNLSCNASSGKGGKDANLNNTKQLSNNGSKNSNATEIPKVINNRNKDYDNNNHSNKEYNSNSNNNPSNSNSNKIVIGSLLVNTDKENLTTNKFSLENIATTNTNKINSNPHNKSNSQQHIIYHNSSTKNLNFEKEKDVSNSSSNKNINFSKLSNSSLVIKQTYKEKYSKKFGKILSSTLGVLLDIVELYISSKPFNTARDSVMKTTLNNNENVSYSIDIYESNYNCEEDRRNILVEQIQSLIISKLRFMQSFSGLLLEKEIFKVKAWNALLLNKDRENNSILSNMSNTKLIMLRRENKEKDVSYTSCKFFFPFLIFLLLKKIEFFSLFI